MGRRIHQHHPAPLALLNAASETLEQYDEDYEEEDLTEALARVHHELTENFADVPTNGPYAAADGYLVYSLSANVWCQICESLEIYEDARAWAYRAMLLAAHRIASEDAHEPTSDVRKAVTGDDRPLVVRAPWE